MPPAPDLEALAPRLLATVREVSDELRPQAKLGNALGLDHSLERDFGLDSLGRVELVARIDRDLGLSLSDAALTEAETPRDLLRFVTRRVDRVADQTGPVIAPAIEAVCCRRPSATSIRRIPCRRWWRSSSGTCSATRSAC